ncbi:conserved hypothetical protein [Candidatus Magnetomoraceae bacterium gMMP-15]
MAFLCSNDLTIEDFLDLVNNFSFPKESRLMAFSPAKACFEEFHFEESFLKLTDQGRIFSPEGELKWRRLDGMMRVVYLGEMSAPEVLIDYSSKLKNLKPQQSELILSKKYKLPNQSSNPVSDKKYSTEILVVENWIDSAKMIKFSRYHSRKYKESNNASK